VKKAVMPLVPILFAAGLIAGSMLALNTAALAQQQRSRNDEPIDVVLARVPEKARGKRNPLENDAQAGIAGAKLFEQHCAECHGESGSGTKRGPSLRGELLQRATPGALFWVATNGVVRRGMPAWSKLPEPQRWQIVSFLASLRTSEQTSSEDRK